MNYSKIAVRYAKAFFLLAKEKSQLKEVAVDMETLLKVEKEEPKIENIYLSPILSSGQKKMIFSKAFDGQFNGITNQFIDLMITNKRESHISGVARNFIERYNNHLGIKKAKLTTAVPMSDEQVQQVKEIIKSTYQTQINMEMEVNSDLIGGLVLRIEDTQYDASIATQLKNIKQELLQ